MSNSKMELLHTGKSNWDYYYVQSVDLVLAKAKANSGASDCWYGSLKYFTKQKENNNL